MTDRAARKTVNQEPAVLQASSDGSSRDTQGRREAGPQPQAAGLLWSRVYVGAVIVAGCAVLSAAIVEMMGQPMIDAEARLDLFDLPGTPFSGAISAPVQNPDGSRMAITLYSSTGGAFSAQHLRRVEQVARLVTAPPPWRKPS